MKSKIIVISLSAAFCFWQMLTGPASADSVCFECHDKAQFTGNVVHQPVGNLQCGTCHNPHVARYKGLLNTREDRLCYSCHKELETTFNQGIVHDPVADGSCSACHAPHVSDGKGLIRDNLADICFSCHEKLPREFPETHNPFARGQCIACHDPHQADKAELLADAPDKLCSSCHDRADLEKGHPDYPGTLRDCLSCHNPHGSERPALIRNILHKPYEQGCAGCHDLESGVTMNSCLKCHDDVQGEMLATRSHLTLHDGNSCLNCHSPHAGDTPSLLNAREKQVCVSCHEKIFAGYRSSSSRHPDINICTRCHEPHGSNHLAMLKGNGNDVCIECHKTQGEFSHPVGPDVLDSHTGQMITCVSCHKPMGTEFDNHLIDDGDKALCIQCHRSY
ncbi:MAG: cytochrome c3 family protein [Desulfobulbaceae bacterium]|nr:cytochrome c3 family protein [Desulfobulbaceae bacterium]